MVRTRLKECCGKIRDTAQASTLRGSTHSSCLATISNLFKLNIRAYPSRPDAFQVMMAQAKYNMAT
jgi:hypothetical protein